MANARWITAKTRIFQLKVQLAGIRPPVRGRVLVPGEIDLGELHEVIQTAFGWSNSQLHQLEIGTARYGIPDPDWGMDDLADESRATLFRLAAAGDRLDYTYDFGDNWVHHVTVEKVLGPNAARATRPAPPGVGPARPRTSAAPGATAISCRRWSTRSMKTTSNGVNGSAVAASIRMRSTSRPPTRRWLRSRGAQARGGQCAEHARR